MPLTHCSKHLRIAGRNSGGGPDALLAALLQHRRAPAAACEGNDDGNVPPTKRARHEPQVRLHRCACVFPLEMIVH